MDKKLKVIPKPEEGTRTVLVLEPDPNKTSTVIKGQGDLNLICGYCESVLCEGVTSGQIMNMVVKCPVCNNYNEVS